MQEGLHEARAQVSGGPCLCQPRGCLGTPLASAFKWVVRRFWEWQGGYSSYSPQSASWLGPKVPAPWKFTFDSESPRSRD